MVVKFTSIIADTYLLKWHNKIINLAIRCEKDNCIKLDRNVIEYSDNYMITLALCENISASFSAAILNALWDRVDNNHDVEHT